MAKRYETPEFDISFTSSQSPEYVRADLLESAEKRIADLTEELNVTTRHGLIYKNERDELAAENASLITARDMMGRLLANAIAEREEARSASAVREIAMRDRAAACSYGYLGAAHIREKISALPLTPDGQQALDDMRADAWQKGWYVGFSDARTSIVTPNPYRKDATND